MRHASVESLFRAQSGQLQFSSSDFRFSARGFPSRSSQTLHSFAKQGEVRGQPNRLYFLKTLSRNLQSRIWKEMKAKSKIGGYIIRNAVYAVCFSVVFVALSLAFQSPNESYKSAPTSGYSSTAKNQSQPRAFSCTRQSGPAVK